MLSSTCSCDEISCSCRVTRAVEHVIDGYSCLDRQLRAKRGKGVFAAGAAVEAPAGSGSQRALSLDGERRASGGDVNPSSANSGNARLEGRGAANKAWFQKQFGASTMAKNWETFKHRNPGTVQQVLLQSPECILLLQACLSCALKDLGMCL